MPEVWEDDDWRDPNWDDAWDPDDPDAPREEDLDDDDDDMRPCPDCGHGVYWSSELCPACGCWVRDRPRPVSPGRWGIALVLIGLLLIAVLAFGTLASIGVTLF